MTFDPTTITVSDFRGGWTNFLNPPYTDTIVQVALQQAQITNWFASCLNDDGKENAFYYLAAHYAILEKQNQSENPENLGVQVGIPSSFKASEYSESREVPKRLSQSMLLSQFETTRYGQTYLNFVKPCLIGGMSVVGGGTVL